MGNFNKDTNSRRKRTKKSKNVKCTNEDQPDREEIMEIEENNFKENYTHRFENLQENHREEMLSMYNRQYTSDSHDDFTEIPLVKATTKFTIQPRQSPPRDTPTPRSNIYDCIPENDDDCVSRRKREIRRMTNMREGKISRNVVNKFKNSYSLTAKPTISKRRAFDVQNTSRGARVRNLRSSQNIHVINHLRTNTIGANQDLPAINVKVNEALHTPLSISKSCTKLHRSPENTQINKPIINCRKKSTSSQEATQVEVLDMSMESLQDISDIAAPSCSEETVQETVDSPQTQVLDLSTSTSARDVQSTASQEIYPPVDSLVNRLPSTSSLRRMLAEALATMSPQQRTNHLSQVTGDDQLQNNSSGDNVDTSIELSTSMLPVCGIKRVSHSAHDLGRPKDSAKRPTHRQIYMDHSQKADGVDKQKEDQRKPQSQRMEQEENTTVNKDNLEAKQM